jgi:hypothetical protein
MIHAKENKEARNPKRSNPVCRVPKTMVASRQRSDVSIHGLIQKQNRKSLLHVKERGRRKSKPLKNSLRRPGMPDF